MAKSFFKNLKLPKLNLKKKGESESQDVDNQQENQTDTTPQKQKKSSYSFFNKTRKDAKPKGANSIASKRSYPGLAPFSKLLNKYKISLSFLLSGLLIIAAIVLYFILIFPLKSEISKSSEELDRKVTQLEKFYRKGRKINNLKSIKVKKEEIEYIENEIDSSKEIFLKKDKILEDIFIHVSGEEISDEALWKNTYLKKTSDLIEMLRSNGINADLQKLSFKTWQQVLPSWEEIKVCQKKFWIQNEIINTIVKSESVNNLRSLTFHDKALSPIALSNPNYKPIPFTLNVDMEHTDLFNLIRLLLNSKLMFFIETININFQDNDERDLDFSIENKILDNVIINAYTIDFISDNL